MVLFIADSVPMVVIPACRESFFEEGCRTSRHDKNTTKELKRFFEMSDAL
jgi:hypothetical protein